MNSLFATASEPTSWNNLAGILALFVGVTVLLGYLAWRSFNSLKGIRSNVKNIENKVEEILARMNQNPTRGNENTPPQVQESRPLQNPGQEKEDSSGEKKSFPLALHQIKRIDRRPETIETHIVRCNNCDNNVIYRRSGKENTVNCPNCGNPIDLQ